jgi:hypothetical protein
MAIVLTDIKQKTGPIPGGAVNLYLVLADDVQDIPAAAVLTGSIDADIVLKAGKTWSKFEFAPGKCKLSNPTVGEAGSKSFQTTLDCTIGGDDPKTLKLFNDMINGRYIAVVDMASMRKKVAGSIRVPLLCEAASWDGGEDQPNINGTVFSFVSRAGFIVEDYTGDLVAGA